MRTMPRQRSKKLSRSLQTEVETPPLLQQHEDGKESDNESLEMFEKEDEDEEELNRLVLGDDVGFMARLGKDISLDEDRSGDSNSDIEESNEGEARIEDVDDADVNFPSPEF